MTNQRVLVLGDLGVDMMIKVPSLPKADQKFNGERVALGAGGMAANVAVALARLGTPVRLAAAVGDDAYAKAVLGALRDEDVELDFVVRRANTPTFMCVVLLAPDGEKALVRLPSAAYLPLPDEITTSCLKDLKHLHTTVGNETLTLHALGLAATHGVSVSIDLEAADLPTCPEITRDILSKTNILFLNKDARRALGAHLEGGPIEGPEIIVTTLGSKGSILSVGTRVIEAPGYAVAVRDTTGAGDAFAAAFLHRYFVSGELEATLAFANAAAALSTQAYGAQTGLPSEAAVRRFMGKHS